MKKCVRFLKSNKDVLAMLVGVLLGLVMGIGLNSRDPKLTGPQIAYLKFPGDIFIQMMKQLLIPIVVSSLLCATAEIDIRSSGKIGLRAMVYFLTTMLLASAVGLTLVVTIRPGERIGRSVGTTDQRSTAPSNPGIAFMDLLRNMVPDNLVEVFFSMKKTVILHTEVPISNTSEISRIFNLTDQKREVSFRVEKVRSINMIGVVAVSILFGCVTAVTGAEAKPFLDFFTAIRCISFHLMTIFIWCAPVGIMCLIAAKLAEVEDPALALESLGMYVVTLMTGMIIHSCLLLPLIYLIIVRKNPFRFCLGMLPALVFAFGSDSSAATLPLTINCLEKKNGVDPRVTKLVASVGATINMDGACVYLPTIVNFVAQLNGIPLNSADMFTVIIVTVSLSIGSPGLPGIGPVYLIMILSALGLPITDIGSILTVDWLLARFRTLVNVLGDAYGAGIIAHLSRHELPKQNTPVTHNSPEEDIQAEEVEALTV